MKKFAPLIVAAFGFTSITFAQDDDAKLVDLPLYVEPGDSASIEYSHIKEKNGTPKGAVISADLNILSVSDETFVASWTTKSVRVGDVLMDASSPQAGSMFIGIPFEFLAAYDGTPTKIYARKELFKSLEKSDYFRTMDKDILNKTLNFFKQMSDETLAATFLKVPNFLSICQSTSLAIGEEIEQTVEGASMIGNETISSIVSYKLISADRENNTAIVEYRSNFDPEGIKNAVISLFKEMAPDKTPTQKEIDNLTVDRRDSADCEVDMDTGWVREMQYSTLINAEGDTNNEKFDITVKWK